MANVKKKKIAQKQADKKTGQKLYALTYQWRGIEIWAWKR